MRGEMQRIRKHTGGRQRARSILSFTLAWVLIGCASVKTESTDYGSGKPEPESKSATPEQQEDYTGPRQLVQVVRFGIPKDVLESYKELADKRVGWGLCNRIVEELYDTDRFDYIEDKEEFLKRVLEVWKAEEAGIFFTEDTRSRQVKSPDYLVYAEVFDFGVSQQERILGPRKREVTVTKMGVQIRFVDTRTMQYTPASATGEAVVKKGGSIWSGLDVGFDETQVGIAAEQAIESAIGKVLKRLDRSRQREDRK